MAWPPAASKVIGEVVSLVPIGTQDLVEGWYVKSARYKPSVTQIPIDNGSAVTAKVIFIQDGAEVEITIVDDRNMATAPTIGMTLRIRNPEAISGPLNAAFTNGVFGAGDTYYVMDPDYNAVEKQPGERVLRCRQFRLF